MHDLILEKYHSLTSLLIRKNLTITTMESCTGGLIGALISDMEGASAIVPGGFFTYQNDSKIDCGVDPDIIKVYGVYSLETAGSMASACRKRYGTDIGIGITGSIATKDPNNADSVPGEVYAAIDLKGEVSGFLIRLTPAARWESRMAIADKVVDELVGLISRE